jgi:hypothetical protein
MTDRPMTPELAAALAALTEADRRHLKILAGETETPWMHALLLGLVAEVDQLERRETIERMNEITILHAHEMDRLADVDKAAEGADWSHCPPSEPRTVAWFPEAAPDDLSELDDGSVET